MLALRDTEIMQLKSSITDMEVDIRSLHEHVTHLEESKRQLMGKWSSSSATISDMECQLSVMTKKYEAAVDAATSSASGSDGLQQQLTSTKIALASCHAELDQMHTTLVNYQDLLEIG